MVASGDDGICFCLLSAVCVFGAIVTGIEQAQNGMDSFVIKERKRERRFMRLSNGYYEEKSDSLLFDVIKHALGKV